MAEGYFAYEVKDGEVCILRCYGSSGSVVIPEKINGLPVTELSAYAFAQEMEMEPENTGERPCICGERLEELYLPRTIKKMGRYIFYNCLRFWNFSFYSNIAFMGAGAFTGCENLRCLTMHRLEGNSCLREILQDLKQKVTVECYRAIEAAAGDGQEMLCRLVYPEFFEEAVENTPARIISTQTHGMGIQYRNAFRNTQVQFREYDRLFVTGKYNIDLKVLSEIVISRLRFPYALEKDAREEYTQWLLAHLWDASSYLLEQENGEDLRWLAESFASASEQIDVLLETAKRREDAQAVSIMMDVKHRRFPTKKKKFCL
jgi:hypothetical protein